MELDESLGFAKSSSNDQVLALHEALLQLERIDERRASVVEARFFGGFSVAEIAALHEISEETVAEDWRGAKAWLGFRVRQAGV
jgi:DNA-directed RNA polymerase specialized sigma24 family protein